MTDTPLPLIGIYRVREAAPGFAICLFGGGGQPSCCQQVGEDGCITGFAAVNVEGSFIFEPPPRPDGTAWSARAGQSMLYAFHRPDGSFAVGPREEVEAAVGEELPSLRATPFLWEEAAGFVRDWEQRRLAQTETAKLLQHPT